MTTSTSRARRFLKNLAAAAVAAFMMGSSWGATQCAPTGTPGVERCVSGLPPAVLMQMQQTQQASNWCWAASISMVLRRYGTEVAQEQIVRTQFGDAVNAGLPAQDILGLLNRTWRGAEGQTVVASAGYLPNWRRSLGLAAPEVIEDLGQDKPLLVGLREHAVVLVQLVYERVPEGGVRLLRAVVLDPASDSGVRTLRPDRDSLEFVARIDARATPQRQQMADAGETPTQGRVF